MEQGERERETVKLITGRAVVGTEKTIVSSTKNSEEIVSHHQIDLKSKIIDTDKK